MKKNLLYIMSGALLLSSCHVYDNYQKSEAIPANLYRDTTANYQALAADTVNFGTMPWQEMFTDPQLQQLIQTALERNSNLLIVDQNIRAAEAGLTTARLAYLPSAVFSPQGTVSSFDWQQAVKTYSFPVTASWQVDANGSLRNAKKQAIAQVLQAKASKQAARTSIIASVANLYYSLQMLDEQLRVTQETSEIWKKNYETMQYMQEAGLTTNAAVASAKANYYQILASIPALQKSIASAENALSLLLREAPHAIARGKAFTAKFPEKLSAGVPLQLLSRRPDVKSAELAMANAFYGVTGAYSKFYPSITLNGTLGFTNSGGAMIVNPGKMIASAVASLVQPLFQRGQIKANLEVAKANMEISQLQFENVLLQAGSEVSNYLMAYNTALRQEEKRQLQVAELESAAEKTMLLFKNTNSTTYLETLTAESNLLNARLSLVNDQYARIQAAINLYTALGGGSESYTEKEVKLYDAIIKK